MHPRRLHQNVFQGADIDGLGEMDVESDFLAECLVLGPSVSAESHQENAIKAFVLSDLAGHVKPGHPAGKPQVTEYDIGRRLLFEPYQRLLTRGCPGSFMASRLETLAQKFSEILIVLDEQDATAHPNCPLPGTG
jgi:hypothetical protein